MCGRGCNVDRKLKNRKGEEIDDGFENWGGYRAAKRAKLIDQFHSEKVEKISNIFAGIKILVNGLTHPSADELKYLMAQHGGEFLMYQASSTTHIIASNLPNVKKRPQNVTTPPTQMVRALENVAKGIPTAVTAKNHGIPQSTLRHEKDGNTPVICSMGPFTILSKEEESLLAEWISKLSERQTDADLLFKTQTSEASSSHSKQNNILNSELIDTDLLDINLKNLLISEINTQDMKNIDYDTNLSIDTENNEASSFSSSSPSSMVSTPDFFKLHNKNERNDDMTDGLHLFKMG